MAALLASVASTRAASASRSGGPSSSGGGITAAQRSAASSARGVAAGAQRGALPSTVSSATPEQPSRGTSSASGPPPSALEVKALIYDALQSSTGVLASLSAAGVQVGTLPLALRKLVDAAVAEEARVLSGRIEESRFNVNFSDKAQAGLGVAAATWAGNGGQPPAKLIDADVSAVGPDAPVAASVLPSALAEAREGAAVKRFRDAAPAACARARDVDERFHDDEEAAPRGRRRVEAGEVDPRFVDDSD